MIDLDRRDRAGRDQRRMQHAHFAHRGSRPHGGFLVAVLQQRILALDRGERHLQRVEAILDAGQLAQAIRDLVDRGLQGVALGDKAAELEFAEDALGGELPQILGRDVLEYFRRRAGRCALRAEDALLLRELCLDRRLARLCLRDVAGKAGLLELEREQVLGQLVGLLLHRGDAVLGEQGLDLAAPLGEFLAFVLEQDAQLLGAVTSGLPVELEQPRREHLAQVIDDLRGAVGIPVAHLEVEDVGVAVGDLDVAAQLLDRRGKLVVLDDAAVLEQLPRIAGVFTGPALGALVPDLVPGPVALRFDLLVQAQRDHDVAQDGIALEHFLQRRADHLEGRLRRRRSHGLILLRLEARHFLHPIGNGRVGLVFLRVDVGERKRRRQRRTNEHDDEPALLGKDPPVIRTRGRAACPEGPGGRSSGRLHGAPVRMPRAG